MSRIKSLIIVDMFGCTEREKGAWRERGVERERERDGEKEESMHAFKRQSNGTTTS